ncbi:crosslink repair DNA glycosylase YcaQ family protein [soil metagenome]
MTVQLSAAAARRFLVERHGLAPARSLPAQPASVLAVIDRLAVLQFDPLEVPGARNHDLVLHARIAGYQRDWCADWLYGPDRRLFEIYNKSLNIVALAELPHYRFAWERYRAHYEAGILAEHADVVADIVSQLAEHGPLSTDSFAHHTHAIDWWWAPTRAARAVLEALFVTGRVGIARREGNRRYYDLIERLVPADLLARIEPEEEAQRHRLMSRYRAVGLTRPSANAEVITGTGTAAERRRRTDELVEGGVLVPVQVEGTKGLRYAVAADDVALREAGANAERQSADAPTVAFIAPLDPLVWDRPLLRDVFEFDYLWEVYVPEARRRWGYYVLPVLFGDRLVGRIEPRLDRASRTLRILGIWWEDGFSPRRGEGFVPALRSALRAYSEFVGATHVEWAPATAGAGRLYGTLGRNPARAT